MTDPKCSAGRYRAAASSGIRRRLSPGNQGQHTIIAVVVAALLAFACHNLISSYSYWGDEIISVITSLSPPKEFLQRVLGDVHPPLYPIVLRIWMAVFGSGEVATRSLSFLLVALSLVALAWLTSGRPLLYRFVALAFLGSSPSFAFYGQETRPYGMLLCLSTITTLLFIKLREKASAAIFRDYLLYFIAALLLSLTHYFGWLWVFFLCMLQLTQPTATAERRLALILLPCIFIWPIIHISLGEISGKTGGNFNQWMHISTPLLSTINRAISGLLPGMEISRQPLQILRWLLLAAALLPLAWPVQSWSQTWTHARSPVPLLLRQSRDLGILIFLFLALVSVIDLHTPMSTARNFIVLLPPLALVLAGLCEALAERLRGMRRLVLFSLILLVLVLQLRETGSAVAVKAYPKSNWKDLAASIRRLGVCRDGCLSDIANTYWTFYFKGIDLEPLTPSSRPSKRPLLLLHPRERLSALTEGEICLMPRQLESSPILLLPPHLVDLRSALAAGLVPCDHSAP